eukprot:TRINITY_DN29362_c1_g1_i1.p2 TRINITY_DN29362_c1_g1~~TRINITY_DN29362_c1_g1_i1.p2  ORF type:complete len:172 (-),score=18.11 TRINITY_DN29362_c1_g1_i1:4-519(-)
MVSSSLVRQNNITQTKAIHQQCLIHKRGLAGLLLAVNSTFSLNLNTNKQKMQIEQDKQFVDSNKPAYHVQPGSGWLNDPNGPIYYKGQYHIFFQHVGDSADWQWRICWGHCVSADLVNWKRLPDALLPTPNSQDANGCWSGCCATNNEYPHLIYTGVVLNNPSMADPYLVW